VRPNRRHHEEWLVSQMAACRDAFDQQHPDASTYQYAAMDHVEFMLATFRSRYPGIRAELGRSFELRIDRNRVVDSTVDEIGSLADDEMPDPDALKIRFRGQEGYDAGGLTDDWLSMFMLEAMSPFRQPPLFLLPKQIDGMKEACCLRLNHSLHAFGINADRERALLRTFGFVLAVCLKRGRFACNRCISLSLYRIFHVAHMIAIDFS
jgi:hypothetical protein